MLNYWFIYLIFVPLGIFFGWKFWEVYESNILNGVLDFFGLAHMFGTPTMNATWWFMSVIILLYLMVPVIAKAIDWSAETTFVVSIILMAFPYISLLPYIGKYFVWLPPFVLGMYFAKRNGFDLIYKHNLSVFSEIALSGSMILLFAFIRYAHNNSLEYDAFFALAIILFSFFIISRIPVLNLVIEQFGKYSGAIFMFHTFIYNRYFIDLIYWFKYPPIIFLMMIGICCLVALGLERLKKAVRYDKLYSLL